MNQNFGDFYGIDVIISDKKDYYKIDGQYYRSRKSIEDSYDYDEVVSAKEALNLFEVGKCELTHNLSKQYLESTTKNDFYRKGHVIYKNKSDYVNEHIENLTRADMIEAMDMLLYS